MIRVLPLLALLVACSDQLGSEDGAPQSSATTSTGTWAGSGTGTGGGSTTSTTSSGGTGTAEAGQLTAGEWRDLDDWAFWLDLTDEPTGGLYGMDEDWGFHFDARYPVLVEDSQGEPLVDAVVTLEDPQGAVLWEARTDADGRAELFDGLFGRQLTADPAIRARSGGVDVLLEAPVPGADLNALVLDGALPADALDVVFIVDTTGSMGDELAYLKGELLDVTNRVVQDTTADLRVGAVYYRDDGDAYLVESVPLGAAQAVIDDMSTRSAGGGGDWPEALDLALQEAVDLQWSTSARSRIAFLVTDAPSHESDVARINAAVASAAARGVRVIPVGASGVARQAEALLRSIDIATGGTYTFLTNDSGIGNPHLEPLVGPYQVEFLNDLLVRLIVESVD